MQAALFTGGTLGPLLGGLFADRFGYRAAFAATSVVFVLAGLAVTLFVEEPPRESPPPSALPTAGRGRAIGPELLAVIFLSVAVRFATNAPLPLLPLFVQQLDADRTHVGATVGTVVAATGVASMVSALLLGRLADRFGRWATLLTCLLAATALAPLHAAATTVWQLLVVRTLMGLALGGMTPSLQAVLTDVTPPHRRGAAFGWLATAGAIGNGGGPLAGSAIAAAFGIPAVFIASAPMFLVGAIVLARLPRVGGAGARPG
jgi:DHA1 family multidrug resistance protein-like MFS transporter